MLSHEDVQAAISARLDGEAYALEDDVIDAHLAGCPECAAYAEKVSTLAGFLGESVSDGMSPPQDLSEVILAGVEPEWRAVSAARQTGLAVGRVLMALTGVIVVAWAIAVVGSSSGVAQWTDGGTLDPGADPEKARLLIEAAALRFGLGMGLFYCVWRPASAPGVLPIVGTMFMFLLGFVVRDVALGTLDSSQVYALLSLAGAIAALVTTWLADRGYMLRALWKQAAAEPA